MSARGLATNLHRLGVSDKVTQTIMRHSNVAVTQTHYVKMVGPDAVAAMNTLEQVAILNVRQACA